MNSTLEMYLSFFYYSGGTPASQADAMAAASESTSEASNHELHGATQNGDVKTEAFKEDGTEIKTPIAMSPSKSSTTSSPQKSPVKKEGGADAADKKVVVPMDDSLLCSGNIETCRVHADQQPRYYFIQTPSQLEALVDALAPKGLRESVLKETVTNEMEYLRNVIRKTPVSK